MRIHQQPGLSYLCCLTVIPLNSDALFQEEVKNFSIPDGKLRSMTYEELWAFPRPILDAVIREMLRLHPPIHSMMRKVCYPVVLPTQDTTYVILKGHYASALPAVSQNNPGIQRHAAIEVERSRARWCTGGR